MINTHIYYSNGNWFVICTALSVIIANMCSFVLALFVHYLEQMGLFMVPLLDCSIIAVSQVGSCFYSVVLPPQSSSLSSLTQNLPSLVTNYKVPKMSQNIPSKVTLVGDALGPFVCAFSERNAKTHVQAGGNVGLRVPSPYRGVEALPYDYSSLPMFVQDPKKNQPLVATNWDLMGSYVKDRPMVQNALDLSAKKAASALGDRNSWLRQHWSYFHMDPQFFGILLQCAFEMNMLYHANLSDAEKVAYGYKFTVPTKAGTFNKVGVPRSLKEIWLPRTYLSFIIGTLLTDGGIKTVKESNMKNFLQMGPHPLGLDLVLLHAAMTQIVGLGRGYVVFQDYYLGNPRQRGVDDCLLNLTHQVLSESHSCTVFNELHKLFYVPNPNKGNKTSAPHYLKLVNPKIFEFFDSRALVYALLCDGGCDVHTQQKNFMMYGSEMRCRNRLYLAVYGFSVNDQEKLAAHMGSLVGAVPSVVPKSTSKGLGYMIEWSAKDTTLVSQRIHHMYPNSCNWKLGFQVTRELDKFPRFGYLEGQTAMALLNTGNARASPEADWVDSSKNNKSAWPLLLKSNLVDVNGVLVKNNVLPINWEAYFAINPDSRSVWHSPAYMLPKDKQRALNKVTYQ